MEPSVWVLSLICERHYLSKGPSSLGQLSHSFINRRNKTQFRFKNKYEMLKVQNNEAYKLGVKKRRRAQVAHPYR
jgi:hypothetical protein